MLILYNPPSSAGRKPVLPLSLLALGAVIEGEHDYAIVDGNLERDQLGALDQAITRTGASMLAVTVMPGPQLTDAVPVCREIKRRHPELTIVWGGYFPTQHYDACLRAEYVDYVVRGHGELVFKSLVDALANGDDPSELPGLALRHPRSGQPWSNPMAPIPHPDRLPDFPYHRVEVARYVRSSYMGQRTLPHHSSYGCPFFCNFCAVVNMVNGRWLAQSAERTANVVHTLVDRWGANGIEFYDNNFFVHEARTAEFSERIRQLRVGWWGESRIDTLLRYSDRSWELMRDSGLKMVFMGAESGSDETLKRMNKGGSASTDKTLIMAEQTARYGIVPEFSFVLGSPPEPAADVEQTLEFVRRVKRVNRSAEIILYMYTPVPASGDLFEQAQAEGFEFPTTLEEWVSPDWQEFSQRRSTQMPWVQERLRNHVRDFVQVLNAYCPTATNHRLQAGWGSRVLQTAGSWRYHLRLYQYPLELRVLQRMLRYQRPETTSY
jgi:anaerobic magnesium-protoporphyrin IX monomethyl ester cyclase